jgi:hypothetical protein
VWGRCGEQAACMWGAAGQVEALQLSMGAWGAKLHYLNQSQSLVLLCRHCSSRCCII